ncbi:UNVERIFIED_CONTAM: hypothetical protein RMT77_009331 [Armadillidium vulgare]
MDLHQTLLILLLSQLTVFHVNGEKVNPRQGRFIRRYLGKPHSYDDTNYPFCKARGMTGACLRDVVCNAESGRFMGYCGYDDGVCCDVTKSCGSSSSAHAVRFQNPAFPNNETEPKICTFDLHVGKGICALRMELETFQLRKYSKDYCPFDSFTVLGTKKGKSSPICGNMTGWITTFEVNTRSTVQIAAVLQGDPAYKFSVLFTMIPCKDVVTLHSPTNAGLINRDAKKYDPPPTPKPNITIFKLTTPTRSESSTESSTTEATTEEATTILTTLMEETITTTEVPEESSEENKTTKSFVPPKRDGGAAADEVTPLPVGSLPDIATPESVIARSLDGYYGNEEGDYEDKTPNSLFKEIFDQKAGDYCPLFKNSDNGGANLRVPHPESIDRDNIDKCWFYDPVESIYKHNEECEWFEEAPDFAQFRIIGGKYANINEYPWQVALIYKQKFFCGGALISDRHVLTASHCVFGSFYGGIHNLSISLGDHDLKTKNETENLLLGVRRVNWNLHYSSDTTENDIAILELERPVEFSYSILPVNLPTDLTNSYSMQNATVTGWGRNSLRSKRTSSVLKKYTAPVDDIDTCVKSWTPYPAISAIKGMHLCLNVTYGTPCHGDSGGPLVSCNNGTRCTLIGVVSFGFPLCRNVGLPAVFTRVTTYKRWIDLNTTPHFYYNI